MPLVTRLLVMALALGLVRPAPAAAQAPSLRFALGYQRSDARRALRPLLPRSHGAGAVLAAPLAATLPLALRVDLQLVAPDETSARLAASPDGRLRAVRLSGTSSLAAAFAGPELTLRAGRVALDLHAGVGVVRFVSDVFVTATDTAGAPVSALVTGGATRLGAQAGADLRLAVAGAQRDVAVVIGGQLQRSGVVPIPLRGEVAAAADGTVSVPTRPAGLDLLALRLGLAVAF